MNTFTVAAALYAQFAALIAEVHQQAESRLSDATDSHDVAAVALELVGSTKATAYQHIPKTKPRTVRNITCRMDMSLEVQTEELEHMASEKVAVLAELQQLAEQAKVRTKTALEAVTRYLNSPERVKTVLVDIHALQTESCRIWNPTGLFVRLMRSGESVKLPERVQQARTEALRAKQEQEQKPTAAPGVLVKLYGEVCRILEVSRQFALVQTRDDDIKVPIDQLRFIPQ